MSESAKSMRSAMKSKAQRLAKGDPKQKVDSSDWTPPEPINADIKTGMRPVSRRAFKKGGKVVGKADGEEPKARADRKARKAGGKAEQPLVDRLINRDVKKANEYRDGIKHVGGMKKGGRAKKLGGGGIGDNPVTEQMKLMGNAAVRRKDGGRTKKQDGGMTMEQMIEKNPAPKKEPLFKGKIPLPPRRKPEPVPPREPEKADPRLIKAKKGGKISHMEWEHSKKDLEQDKKLAKKHGMSMEKWEKSKLDEKHDKQQSTKGLKKGGGVFSGPSYPGKVPGAVGGRTARKSGGRTKGKTHINIMIATGKGQDVAQPPVPPMGSRGPAPMPVPMPVPAAGAMPMPMPAAPAAGPGNIPPQTMMGRKAGGRVYRSAKDMDAGAGSGLGRLEKTEIEQHKRTGRKHGGKAYRSYKDMDAGAGSGEGRLEKTEIQKSKKYH